MTHASVPAEKRLELGILDNMIRLSVGIEHEADLLADLAQALTQAGFYGPMGDAPFAIGSAAKAAVEQPLDGVVGAVGAMGGALGMAGAALMDVWPLSGSLSEPSTPSAAGSPGKIDLRSGR